MAGISLILQNNPTVTQINCGTSSPKLGGAINLSAFPNLQDFRCQNNDITAISGYENNITLTFINLIDNKITGSLPSFTGTPNLRTAVYSFNLYTGTIPNYNSELRNFQCAENLLSGQIPDLNNNNGWTNFLVHNNNLIGPIPPSLSNQSNILVFSCYGNPLTGSIPNINACGQLQRFLIAGCSLSGSIPNLSNNVNLTECWFHSNFLTGSIPSLSANNQLTRFLCYLQRGTSKITGFAGGSVSITLGDFQAQDNQLRASAVNSILASFVAAGRTTGTPILNGTCILNLGGATNSRPTGQGVTDVTTLRNRGWTVTTGTALL
jgi:hypothetical protein